MDVGTNKWNAARTKGLECVEWPRRVKIQTRKIDA